MHKAHLGRSMLEMLLVLVIMGLIAAGGVWGVEYAIGLYTKNQIEREVITQISSLRMRSRPLRESTINTRPVKSKYITSRAVHEGSIVLTAEDLSEDVCRALLKDNSEASSHKKGYSARLAGGGDASNCGSDNTVEFVSILRSVSNACAGVSVTRKCTGEDEYEDGCLVRERLYCGVGQECLCEGDDCLCAYTTQTCSTGQKLINDECVDCGVDGCLSYSEGCTCSSCSSEYTLSDGRCLDQSCHMDGCAQFTEGCVCQQCLGNYTQKDNKCCLTKNQCTGYNDDCTCTGCEQGYTLYDNTCVKCHSDGCALFDSKCVCLSCQEGYSLKTSGGCCENIDYCETPNKTCTGCDLCMTGYTEVSGKCCPEIDGCGAYDGDCKCTACSLDNTKPNVSKNGKACCGNIDYCEAPNDTCTGCADCITGYIEVSGKCCPEVDGCGAYDGNCKCTACSLDNTKPKIGGGGTVCCGEIDGCGTYDGNCKCTACSLDNTKPKVGGGGTVCCGEVSGCGTYDEDCACTACSLDNSKPKVGGGGTVCCGERTYCTTYDKDCKCSACYKDDEDVYLSATNEKCCPWKSGCATYSDADCSCSACEGDYTRSLDTNNVPYCCLTKEHCSSYKKADCECSGCDEGYLLTVQEHCYQCDPIDQCDAYDDGCTCATCSGVYVKSENAKACCSPQEGCSAYNQDCSCKAVEIGYTLYEGRSCPTKSKCTAYDENCDCTACENKYYVLEGSCSLCPEVTGCSTYDGSCVCTDCEGGFKPDVEGKHCCSPITDCGSYSSATSTLCQCTSCQANPTTGRSRFASRNSIACCDIKDYCNTYGDLDCACEVCTAGKRPANDTSGGCADCGIEHCSGYSNAGVCYCSGCDLPYKINANHNRCCDAIENCLENGYSDDCTCTGCFGSIYTTSATGTKCCQRVTYCSSDLSDTDCTCSSCSGDRILDTTHKACCEAKTGCTAYNADCTCNTCDSTAHFVSDGSGGCKCDDTNHWTSNGSGGCQCAATHTLVDGVCLKTCMDNNDCSSLSNHFCAFEAPSSCSVQGTGTCRPIGTFDTKMVNGRKLVKSTSSGMTWWSAENWCKRQTAPDGTTPLSLVSRDDLGCGHPCGATNEYRSCSEKGCTTYSGNVYAYNGSFYNLLQTTTPVWMTSESHWLSDIDSNSCYAYGTTLNDARLGPSERSTKFRYALCACPGIANCTTYNDSCACAGCDSTAHFVSDGSGGCKCAPGFYLSNGICTTCPAAGCSVYSDGCTCGTCNSAAHFILSNGSCTCDSSKNWTANGTNACQCANGYPNTSTSGNVCCANRTGCTAYSDSCTCATCDSNAHFVADGAGGCTCDSSHRPNATGSACCAQTVTNCATYNNDCSTCQACAEGWTLVGNVCYKTCSNNTGCTAFANHFCYFDSAAGCGGSGVPSKTGTCRSVNDFNYTGTTLAHVIVASNTTEWLTGALGMNWFSTQNWCSAKGYTAATNDSNLTYVPHEGSVWKGTNTSNVCIANTSGSAASKNATNVGSEMFQPACYKSYTSGGLNKAGCLAYNADNMNCIQCDTSAHFNLSNGSCACSSASYPNLSANGVACCADRDGCTAYSDSCTCATCDSNAHFVADGEGGCMCAAGYEDDGNGGCVLACGAVGDSCTTNDTCCSGNFCAFENASSCTEESGEPDVASGTCISVADFGTGTGDYTKTVTVDGVSTKFVRSSEEMTWWSAKNWCERQNTLMSLARLKDIGCGDFGENKTMGYCTESGNSGSGRSGSVLALLQTTTPKWNTRYHWLMDEYSSCRRYFMRFDNSRIYSYSQINKYYALCKCQIDGCVTYGDGCSCATCDTSAHFTSNGSGGCMCADGYEDDGNGGCKIDPCTTYSGTTCTACASGYTKIYGKCYPQCENNSACATTEYCHYDYDDNKGCSNTNATEYVGKKPKKTYGGCIPTSAYKAQSQTVTVDGVTKKFTRSRNYLNSTYGFVNWWSAWNWCKRQMRADGTTPMEMVSAADLGCTTSSCPTSGSFSAALKSGGWSDYHWLSDNYGSSPSCSVYIVYLSSGAVYANYFRYTYGFYALCE